MVRRDLMVKHYGFLQQQIDQQRTLVVIVLTATYLCCLEHDRCHFL